MEVWSRRTVPNCHAMLERCQSGQPHIQRLEVLWANFIHPGALRLRSFPTTSITSAWVVNESSSLSSDYFLHRGYVSGIEEILDLFVPLSNNIPRGSEHLPTFTVDGIHGESFANRYSMAFLIFSHTWVFASTTTWSTWPAGIHQLPQCPPSQPCAIGLLLDGIPYFWCPPRGSGIAAMTYIRDQTVTVPEVHW